ncbi:hypothetical protein HUK65_14815 [Rhodobacteraceae bacterium 2376]|uniref:Uncharacterized protein n=1 Tax=Rhabdonatronobacter sediminivivens TaxID=2743469 RepID=A0A7Z0I1L8_9RHOB|nr:hypothetical protein [Rhabdonatronobacter sediminivivens]NYS26259.1 hypothetical protein [Rhabdonatronobacter sediminivivens]
MDFLVIAYYAAVCSALAGISPRVPGRVMRYLVGAMVGGISAIMLPTIRAALGI